METKQILKTILDQSIKDHSSKLSFISTDLEGNILHLNSVAEKLLGYKANEVNGLKINRLHPFDEDTKKTVGEAVARLLSSKQESSCEVKEKTKDGKEVRLQLILCPTLDKNGKLIAILGLGEEVIGREVDPVQETRKRLEIRIQERNSELSKANEALQKEILQRKLAEEKLRSSNDLSEAIRDAQTKYISHSDRQSDANPLFEKLLNKTLSLTQSKFGFIGNVLFDSQGKPYLKCRFITNISWNDETRELYKKNEVTGFEFHNLNTLFGSAITSGQPVISSSPATDPRRGGLPEGHPPLNSFLGLPLIHAGQMIGMVGMANRPQGYNEELIEYLQPILATSAGLIQALNVETQRKEAETALKKAKDGLEARVQERTADLAEANRQLQREISERQQKEVALQQSESRYRFVFNQLRVIVEGTASSIGDQFLRSLVTSLAKGLQVSHAFIGEVTDETNKRIRTLAFWADGVIIQDLEYSLAGTPCENIVGRELCCYPQQVQKLFPKDKFLQDEKIESYAGIPLFDSDGKSLGLLAILDRGPMSEDTSNIQAILKIFAARAEAEILRQRAETQLKDSRERLRNLSNRLQTIREMESARIAREVHDEVGQMLTALKMDMDWMKNNLRKDQKPLQKKIQSMDQLLDTSIQTVQKITSDLRPPVLDVHGLCEAIKWQTREFQKRTGIPCKLTVNPENFFAEPGRSTTVFRIFQETLTNVTRHANATRVRICLNKKMHHLTLEVHDNGKGITEEQTQDTKSLGLIGMQERALLWGGKIHIRGIRDKGTTVKVHLPLEEI